MVLCFKNLRWLSAVIIGVISLSVNAKGVATANDSVFCFVLKPECQDMELSRSQFVMQSDSICIVYAYQAAEIDSVLSRLDYIRKLDYSSDEFALDWVVENDSIIYLQNLSSPIKALLVRYCPREQGEKVYTKKHIVSLVWITADMVYIDDKEYRLSPELSKRLFND